MAFQFITVSDASSSGVTIVTLNRPEVLNAWHTPMRQELMDAFAQAAQDDAVTAVVVTGAGERAFSAGQDLTVATGFDADSTEAWIDEFHALYRSVRALEKPVVAALNGVAAGSAFQYVLLTDVRVGHAGVRMGQPEINNGIASITGPWIMKEVLGLSRTVEMTLTGRLAGAEEALALGMLHHLVPQAEVLPTAQRIAAELGAKPPVAMRLIKRRFWEVLEPGLAEAVAAAKRYHRESFAAGEPQRTAGQFLAERAARKTDSAGGR